jgi:glycosyltransferase involved in cell wall biosynthesis
VQFYGCKSLRIALVSASFPSSLDEDPVFPATFLLALGLKKLGHELLVLTCNTGDEERTEPLEVDLNGIRTVRIPIKFDKYATFAGLSQMPAFSWQAVQSKSLFEEGLKILREFRPDVLEVHDFNGVGFFFSGLDEFPLVVRCYGPMSFLIDTGNIGDFAKADRELVSLMEAATVSAADQIIAICHDIARWWKGETNRSDISIIKVPYQFPPSLMNSLSECELLNKCTKSKGPDEEDESQSTDRKILFYWGRVERQKGADLLIEVLPLLKKKYPGLIMKIGGSETTEHGSSEPYANFMRRRLDELGLTEDVEFLGKLDRKDIFARARQADICIFPSRYETAGYTCLEAASYGCAVLATRVGGIPEYGQHGETVWLVEPDNKESLAEGIDHLLSNPSLRKKLADKAPEYIAEICNPENIALESLSVYAKAIESHQSRKSCPNEKNAYRAGAFSIIASRLGESLEDVFSTQIWGDRQTYKMADLERAYHEGQEAGMKMVDTTRGKSLGDFAYSTARYVKRHVIAMLKR